MTNNPSNLRTHPTPWRIEHLNVPLADTGDYDGLTKILAADGDEVAHWWNADDVEEALAERIVQMVNSSETERLRDELREARLETARVAAEGLRAIGSAVETPAKPVASKQQAFDEAQIAFERWHVGISGDASEKAKSWKTGYASALLDQQRAPETKAPRWVRPSVGTGAMNAHVQGKSGDVSWMGGWNACLDALDAAGCRSEGFAGVVADPPEKSTAPLPDRIMKEPQ